MPHEPHLNPIDPNEWLRRAKSNLIQAGHHQQGIYFEDLLFLAQQAAEKAFKALLLTKNVKIPHTHSLARLITELKKYVTPFPEHLEKIAWLTDFSVNGRYPNAGEPVSEEEYKRGLRDATIAVEWVEKLLADA